MYIYTLVTVLHTERGRGLHNIIASYTDEQIAIKELEWRRKTEQPNYLHLGGQLFNRQYSTAARHPDRTYEIIRAKLITDKFTEFALGATNEQSDTDGHLQHFS